MRLRQGMVLEMGKELRTVRSALSHLANSKGPSFDGATRQPCGPRNPRADLIPPEPVACTN